jgi:hypothetical protein
MQISPAPLGFRSCVSIILLWGKDLFLVSVFHWVTPGRILNCPPEMNLPASGIKYCPCSRLESLLLYSIHQYDMPFLEAE